MRGSDGCGGGSGKLNPRASGMGAKPEKQGKGSKPMTSPPKAAKVSFIKKGGK